MNDLVFHEQPGIHLIKKKKCVFLRGGLHAFESRWDYLIT
jgi:hypothetical protein